MVVAIVLAVVVALALTGCLSTKNPTTDIFELVTTGTPQDVQAVITNGAYVNAQDASGTTPLMYAAEYNPNPDVIAVLLKAGADVNAADNYGLTPLMWAAEYNQNPEVITTLLNAGADLKAQDKSGFTALMIAASRSHNPEIITTLLKAGADAKAKNSKGYTAFDYAKYNRYLEGTDALKKLEEASKANENGSPLVR
jgi:ankyrin repeat protein